MAAGDSSKSWVADFKKLKVWQKAHLLAMNVHRVAGRMRAGDHLSLRSQMVRSAMSVPTNIVEGSSQTSARQFTRFLRIALNSTSELEYHLIVAENLNAISGAAALTLRSQVIEVRKMLYALIRRVSSRAQPPGVSPGDELLQK